MQQNASKPARIEAHPPDASQNMYPSPVINSWLRSCLS